MLLQRFQVFDQVILLRFSQTQLLEAVIECAQPGGATSSSDTLSEAMKTSLSDGSVAPPDLAD
jgi:hypothetical protein